MNNDIQGLVRESVRAVALIVTISIIMLGVLAVVHDGSIAQTISLQLEAAVQWGLPVIGAVVVVLQVVTAYVAGKQEDSGRRYRDSTRGREEGGDRP